MNIGIDEVGRGAWAGPLLVVAAAGDPVAAVKDSKTLSRKSRVALTQELRQVCRFGEGWVSAREIDEYGLTRAMKVAVGRALEMLGAKPGDSIIMDGHINYCAPKFANVRAVIKADALHPIVSAASIYAKVARDTYMATLDAELLGYNFAQHVGYGTRAHKEAIERLGVTEHHRLSFKPVKALA